MYAARRELWQSYAFAVHLLLSRLSLSTPLSSSLSFKSINRHLAGKAETGQLARSECRRATAQPHLKIVV